MGTHLEEAGEALYRAIVESTPDAVIVADQAGVVTLWNGGAERIFGFSAAEAVGRSLDLIVPERLRQRHWEGYRRVMDTGQTRYGTGLLAVPTRQPTAHSPRPPSGETGQSGQPARLHHRA